jgi:hypothetical protein
MYNGRIRILCSLYLKHFTIYINLEKKGTNVYFEYIQVVFQINTKHIGAISQVYPRFIIVVEIIIIILLL